MQAEAFYQSEGSEWLHRNRKAIESPLYIGNDWPLRMIDMYSLDPRTVVEIGCSNAWRLAVLSESGRRYCIGVDASSAAIEDGKARYPHLDLYQTLADQLYTCIPDGCAQLLVISYVYHWLDRSSLLAAAAQADRVLAEGGYLIVNDFAPDAPTRVPYKHREGLWTYKMPEAYSGLWLSTGCYRLVASVSYDHDALDDRPDVPSERRGMCCLLRKESMYR